MSDVFTQRPEEATRATRRLLETTSQFQAVGDRRLVELDSAVAQLRAEMAGKRTSESSRVGERLVPVADSTRAQLSDTIEALVSRVERTLSPAHGLVGAATSADHDAARSIADLAQAEVPPGVRSERRGVTR